MGIPFFTPLPSLHFCGQLFLCCLVGGGVWRMGPFLPNCRFKGFFILVHTSLKMHLFFKALYPNSNLTANRLFQPFNEPVDLKFACKEIISMHGFFFQKRKFILEMEIYYYEPVHLRFPCVEIFFPHMEIFSLGSQNQPCTMIGNFQGGQNFPPCCITQIKSC